MSSKKVILFPGSFDPFTLAHEQIVRQALSFFDEVVVGIGCNIFKQGFLSVPNRITLIEKVFENEERVRVVNYDSLTVDFCAKNNIHHIVRGLRNYADFEMERDIADINTMIDPNIITIYLTTSKVVSSVSSSAIREIIKFGGNPVMMLPSAISVDYLRSLSER